MPGTDLPGSFLLYDGECPICARYVAWTRLRESHPGIVLADARAHPALVAAMRAGGHEVNETIILCLEGRILAGAAATRHIAALAAPRPAWARGVVGLVGHRSLARPLYPWLVASRRLLLRLLGRPLVP